MHSLEYSDSLGLQEELTNSKETLNQHLSEKLHSIHIRFTYKDT